MAAIARAAREQSTTNPILSGKLAEGSSAISPVDCAPADQAASHNPPADELAVGRFKADRALLAKALAIAHLQARTSGRSKDWAACAKHIAAQIEALDAAPTHTKTEPNG